MFETLLAEAPFDPFYLRLLMIGGGAAGLIYTIYQISHGGAYCHTGFTKFSPLKFYRFDEAPLRVALVWVCGLFACGVVIYLAIFRWAEIEAESFSRRQVPAVETPAATPGGQQKTGSHPGGRNVIPVADLSSGQNPRLRVLERGFVLDSTTRG